MLQVRCMQGQDARSQFRCRANLFAIADCLMRWLSLSFAPKLYCLMDEDQLRSEDRKRTSKMYQANNIEFASIKDTRDWLCVMRRAEAR